MLKLLILTLTTSCFILHPAQNQKIKRAQKAWNVVAEDWSRRSRQAGIDGSIDFDITITKPHDIKARLELREPTRTRLHEQVVKLALFVGRETAKTRWPSRDLEIQITTIPAARVYFFTIKTATCRMALPVKDTYKRANLILKKGNYGRLRLVMKVKEKW